MSTSPLFSLQGQYCTIPLHESEILSVQSSVIVQTRLLGLVGNPKDPDDKARKILHRLGTLKIDICPAVVSLLIVTFKERFCCGLSLCCMLLSPAFSKKSGGT